jgi:hypothetical protein
MNSPEITTGANELGAGQIVDTEICEETGHMETPGDVESRQATPGKEMPLSSEEESDTETYGDPQ